MLIDKIQLETDEVVLTQVRKHWFVLAIEIFGVLVAATFPFLLVFFVFRIEGMIGQSFTLPAALGTALSAAWLLLMWMALFTIWTNYYLDIWIVTNKRLVAVDQRGLFHRTVASFRLERLQDMTVDMNGLIATFLNYGSVKAQTASGGNWEFRVHGLPNPREFKALVLKAADMRLSNAFGGNKSGFEV